MTHAILRKVPFMFRIKTLLPAALLVGSFLPAALSAGVGDYFKDRGNDVLDIFRLRAGFPEHGRSFGVKARVTSVAQLGYVTFNGTYAGLDRRGVGVVDEWRREGGVSLLYGSFNEMETRSGNHFLEADTNWSILEDRRILRNLPHWDDGRRRPLSIGAELALPIGALDLGIYPEEAFDFVLGLFTLDVFNDDVAQDVTIPNADATAAPVASAEAPFADVRARNAKVKAELEAKKLASSTTQDADSTATLVQPMVEIDPVVAPAPAAQQEESSAPAPSAESIGDEEATRLAEELRRNLTPPPPAEEAR